MSEPVHFDAHNAGSIDDEPIRGFLRRSDKRPQMPVVKVLVMISGASVRCDMVVEWMDATGW